MKSNDGATESRISYIEFPKEEKVFKVTAKYNYSPLESYDLALEQVMICPVCPVFNFRLL